ncbi:hypothetical protein K438DRAFT_1783712 [Mycena galopus ATCC 62051]|nr:hypothetical protein K438DRAFT_1783712 [Mycena galopus ATCC 62051]
MSRNWMRNRKLTATVDHPRATLRTLRSAEILDLANCLSAVSCCIPEKDWSEMIVSPTHSFRTKRYNAQFELPGPGSGYTTWEGNQKRCTFSTSVTFEDAINSSVQSLADYLYFGVRHISDNWRAFQMDVIELPIANTSFFDHFWCL